MKYKIKLTKKQLIAFDYLTDNISEEIVFGGGAGGGKSFLGCLWITSMCLRYPSSRWMMGRKELKALKQTTVRTLLAIFQIFDLQYKRDYTVNQQLGEIHIKNGSEIILKDLEEQPRDPDFNRLGSHEYTGAFIDEAQEITQKAKDTVDTRLRYKVDRFGIIGKVLMTCNPAKNFLYTEFYKKHKKKIIEKEKKFIQALATDNPYVGEKYIEKLKRKPKEIQQRLLYGNWDYADDSNQLVTFTMWEEALIGVFPKTKSKVEVGIDIAREGKDETVIVLILDDVLVDIHKIKIDFNKQSVISKELSNYIIRYLINNNIGYQDVSVDAIGVGAGVVDYLKDSGYLITEFKAGENSDDDNFMNKRAEVFWSIRERLQSGDLYIYKEVPYLEELEKQLFAHHYAIDDKMIKIEKKDKIKKAIGQSPDIADALSIAMNAKPKSQWEFISN